MQILIVEDEALIAEGLRMEVEALGGMVAAVADSVADALRYLGETPCDGVILDMDLRGERSDPIADKLSQLSVPYVITTGYAMRPSEEAPTVPHFTKPFLEREVLSKLGELMAAGRV